MFRDSLIADFLKAQVVCVCELLPTFPRKPKDSGGRSSRAEAAVQWQELASEGVGVVSMGSFVQLAASLKM